MVWLTRLALVAFALLPYWPGGDSRYSTEPTYRHDIAVIDTVGGNAWYRDNLRGAIREWNACGAVRLYLDSALEPYTPKTITIYVDPPGGQEPPYGWWNADGEYGFAAVGGGWTRARSTLAHEIGHALGFGHAKDVNTTNPFESIMGQSEHVSEWDCEGLRRFY